MSLNLQQDQDLSFGWELTVGVLHSQYMKLIVGVEISILIIIKLGTPHFCRVHSPPTYKPRNSNLNVSAYKCRKAGIIPTNQTIRTLD